MPKVIDFNAAKEKAHEKLESTSSIEFLSLDDAMDILRNIALSTRQDLSQLITKAEHTLNIEYWDIPDFRAFLIDVINLLDHDEIELQNWINQKLTEIKHHTSCFKKTIKTPEQLLSELVYDIAVNGFDVPWKHDDPIAFAASLYWVSCGFYDGSQPISLNHFIYGAIVGRYDFDAHYAAIEEESRKICATWFSEKMTRESSHFAVLMMDGNVIEFSHLNAISLFNETADSPSHLTANLAVPEENLITKKELNRYAKRIIHDGMMVITLNNVVCKAISDGSSWLEGELENDAYRLDKGKVSINLRHVIRHESGKNGEQILFLNVSSLGLPEKDFFGEEESITVILREAVMFFEIL